MSTVLGRGALCLGDVRIEVNTQAIDGAKHEAQLGARMTAFDLDDPLPADADLFGESCLIEFELLAPVSNDGAQVSRCAREHDVPICNRSPTYPLANGGFCGFAERLIGSIRCECLDHIIVFGEAHLRRVLRSNACYYNDIRTHRSLDKDAPVSRPIQRTGIISSQPILGGLHHHYVRV
jgi:integrase-like protein